MNVGKRLVGVREIAKGEGNEIKGLGKSKGDYGERLRM